MHLPSPPPCKLPPCSQVWVSVSPGWLAGCRALGSPSPGYMRFQAAERHRAQLGQTPTSRPQAFPLGSPSLAQGSGFLLQFNSSFREKPSPEDSDFSGFQFFLPALGYLFILRLAESPKEENEFLQPAPGKWTGRQAGLQSLARFSPPNSCSSDSPWETDTVAPSVTFHLPEI